MRDRRARWLTWMFLGLALLDPAGALRAQTASRPFYQQAKASYDALSDRDRNEIYLELIATGDFNALTTVSFGERLYDATATFQAREGVDDPSGVLTPNTRNALAAIGGRIFNSWNMAFLDHPFAPASLAVPGRFGLIPTATARGVALENRNHTLSIDYSFFPAEIATLDDIFGRLTRPVPGRHIDLQVIRQTYFAIVSGAADSMSYSRYIVVPGGIAGFTVTWSTTAYPNGGRIAVVMANEIYPRHMNTDEGQSGDLFAAGPADRDLTGSAASAPLSQQSSETNQAVKAKADAEQAQQEAAAEQAALERVRIAQQKEAEQRAKVAEVQAARQAAAAQQRADRLARAQHVASVTLADATAFVKANRDEPNILGHLQQIADLNSLPTNAEPTAVEAKTAALAADLQTDPLYAAFAAQRDTERKREAELTLRDTLGSLKLQKRFIVKAVTDDPLVPAAADLLGLAKQADAVLSAPDLDRAQTLVGLIDAAITKAGMTQRFKLEEAQEKLASGSTSSPISPAENAGSRPQMP